MTLQSIATKMAAVPQRAIDGLPSLPTRRFRLRRNESVGKTIAAMGLGFAVGIAIGLLLRAGPPAVAQADSTSGEPPAQYT